jgi:L-fucose mutarotase/ribose pyranase (RbsD/FucU family)
METNEMPPDNFDLKIAIIELDKKVDKLSMTIETITVQMKDMSDKLEKMNNIVFEPDQGLYARIKNQDIKITNLQDFKHRTNKGFWVIMTSIIGIFSKFIIDFFSAN